MNIEYKKTKNFTVEELQDLFLSVEWASGHYPEKLAIAMKNSGTVFSAWNDNKLIGLISVMDDGIMNAYIHYLLINPEFQAKGIGKNLVKMVTDEYKEYLRVILIAYEREAGFYQHCGFSIGKEKAPMFITSLWT